MDQSIVVPRSRSSWEDNTFISTAISWDFNNTYKFLLENRRELLIGITTILLCTQALLMSKLAQTKSHEPSVSVSITLLFEIAKFSISLALLAADMRNSNSNVQFNLSWSEASLFAIPAIIYLINDNLLFVIHTTIEEPTTFEILGNMRILTTSVLYRVVFKRPLHRVQWAALLLLCIGSGTSQLVTCGATVVSNITTSVLVYAILSGLSGVYTEYVMKRRANDSFYLQNVQLYGWGVVINAFVLFVFYGESLQEKGGFWELALGTDYLTGFVVINHALSGLAVSATIKYTDNIARVYSHAMGMLLTMVVSAVIFWQVPSIQLLFGASIVSISIYLYYTDLREIHTE